MKTIDEMCAVMQAFKDGKKIECKFSRLDGDTWDETVKPHWNWEQLDYRVKPEPKYVPYDSVNEVDRSKWVKRKDIPSVLRAIIMMDTIKDAVYITRFDWVTLKEFFENYEYEDDTPCGKLVSE